MKLTEKYIKKYFCDDGESGLVFDANCPEGFIPEKEWIEHRSSVVAQHVTESAEVEFGGVSDEVSEYILQNFCDMLQGAMTVWRVATIIPKPGTIRFELVCSLGDFYNLRPLTAKLEEEILGHFKGGDQLNTFVDVPGDEYGRYYFRFVCGDEHSPNEKCRIALTAHAHSPIDGERPWKAEWTHVEVKQKSYDAVLRWKSKKRNSIIAEIEETH